MIIGVPTEIKESEYRVAMVPAGVESLCGRGHKVLMQAGAGIGSGITDPEYQRVGAEIVKSAATIYKRAEMIVKVKEPLPAEYKLVRKGQLLFTYLHFAASRELTLAMMRSGADCVAYETIEPLSGGLPLLTPMSEVAGRMAVQEGAKYLERPMEGRGILLAGVSGVAPADVVIIGGGIVGANAARIAGALGARVTVLDINLDRLRYLSDVLPLNVRTVMSDSLTIRESLRDADLVIVAVLVPGARAPQLVRREHLKIMRPRAVMVDVAIDQGGCFETSRPTTHKDPIYAVDGIIHYCVANMPGAVSRTSTYALTNVTLPYVAQLADKGLEAAARDNIAIKRGINITDGKITFRGVAEAHGLKYHEL